jgi:ABC-type multidrug transport system ATPase subunit
MELTRMATRRLGKDVLDLESVTVTVPGKVLFDDVTWRLGPGDRYGVVGVNGAGKTTLLALLAGRREADSGRVKRGKTIHVRELSQDVAELDDLGDLKAVEVIEQEKGRVVVDGKELTASQLTEKLGFTRERAYTPVRDLSGGERRRLQLLRLLVAEPNVLLLDEPTNDLDTDTLAAVEDLLDGWLGTLIVVSHDRYLLERVADRQVALLGDGTIRDLPGGVEEYLRLRAAAKAAGASASGTPAAAGQAGGGSTSGAGPASGGGADGEPSQRDIRAAKKEVSRIERRLAKIAQKEAELHETIAQQATDYQAVARLDAELRDLASERDELEAAWLEAAEVAG